MKNLWNHYERLARTLYYTLGTLVFVHIIISLPEVITLLERIITK